MTSNGRVNCTFYICTFYIIALKIRMIACAFDLDICVLLFDVAYSLFFSLSEVAKMVVLDEAPAQCVLIAPADVEVLVPAEWDTFHAAAAPPEEQHRLQTAISLLQRLIETGVHLEDDVPAEDQ